MTVLTPQLASRMLDVWERRRWKRGPFDTSVLEAARENLPDHLPVHRGAAEAPKFRKTPNGKWVKIRPAPQNFR